MPLRIVTDEATQPNDPPRPCPRGLRRLSPAAVSRRSGQYRRGPYIVRGFKGAGDAPTPGNFGISTGRGWGGVSNVKM